ncbi:MAG: uroporphyrinogen-III synthase [Sphingopyxis sp.]|uniref:uroporphyrinogen-III synthase n=1 Tax=Sphingopyxis sp. TaxID=1908224 RepID=UPI002ABA654F|nr:uroporphyrinogen-III synthase [Sphingopyxis sp.]MDZ3831997.1 uroporphyrinogen-III synthase [Sphingopyxis sp.]
MTPDMPLIVTRPEPGCTATVSRARAMGLDARPMPLFAAHPIDWAAPSNPAAFDALLFTSAQAPRLAGPMLSALAGLPGYAVGAATAASASAAGVTVAMIGDSDGQHLIDAMAPMGIRRILWLCGRDRSHFGSPGTEVTAVPCYAVDRVAPPAVWSGLVAAPAVIMVHSRRAAEYVAEQVAAPKHLSLIAISPAVAAAAGGGWRQIGVAERPDDAAMLAQAVALCHKSAK